MRASPTYAETPAQQTARANVETQSATLGVAQSEAQAVVDQAKLDPVVKAAIGAGAGRKLLETTRDGSVAADIVKDTGGLKVKREKRVPLVSTKPLLKRNGTEGREVKPGAQTARRRVRAHTAYWEGCWNGAYSMWHWWVSYGEAGWIYINPNEWCGNGYSMTFLFNPTFASWSWGPFCLTGTGTAWAWDVWPSWVHGAIWSNFGFSYVWGCFGYSGGKAAIRIAANGYADTYDDLGF